MTTEDTFTALDDITGAIESLGTLLRDGGEFETLLRTICEQAVYAVPGIDMASITVMRDGQPSTAATTDEAVNDLDLNQYHTGVGPCLTAADSGKLVCVGIAEARTRWPGFAAASDAQGIGSFLCAPLTVDSEFGGALNGYGLDDDGFSTLDAKLLDLYTAAAENSLYGVRRFAEAKQTVGQLETALTSRATIDQAKGVLMALRRIDADTAFTSLIEQSQRENIKLRDVAQRIVDAAMAASG